MLVWQFYREQRLPAVSVMEAAVSFSVKCEWIARENDLGGGEVKASSLWLMSWSKNHEGSRERMMC